MREPRIASHLKDPLMRRGFQRLASERPAVALESFYSQMPFRYPSLFEQLCRSYSWGEVVLGDVELAENPVAPDLSGLAASVAYDPLLWAFLVPRGYLIFGRMSRQTIRSVRVRRESPQSVGRAGGAS